MTAEPGAFVARGRRCDFLAGDPEVIRSFAGKRIILGSLVRKSDMLSLSFEAATGDREAAAMLIATKSFMGAVAAAPAGRTRLCACDACAE